MSAPVEVPALALAGCAPTPLASYLKALGVLRLVVEQGADAGALGAWEGDTFVLRTRLTAEELLEFFLHRYRPSPIVAPWNGGSGFYPKDNQSGIGPLENAAAGRFAELRTVIGQCRALIGRLGLTERPAPDAKARMLTRLRGELPEEALAWFDAAVVLGDEAPRYPPLLGTGGNDGRLDFTNNFMQRLVDLFDPATGEPAPGAGDALRAALFGAPTAQLTDAAIGQFSPGDAGGPNATTGFSGPSRVNRWDFVLMLEGALLFAAAATRRLGSGQSAALSFPFAVRPTAAGTGSGSLAEEGNTRGELWVPLWARPMSLDELRHLLSEGRATVGRRAARDGLDFARAVASLGVDRGIGSFQRYQFVMRSGRAYLATPVGRRWVPRNPQPDLVADLDRFGYLERLRRFARQETAPARIRSLTRRLEDAIFDLTGRHSRDAVQRILILLGELQAAVAASRAAREALRPLHRLRPDWAEAADDGTPEFRIAASLAGLHGRSRKAGDLEAARQAARTKAHLLPMKAHLVRVDPVGGGWQPGSALVVWQQGAVARSLGRVVLRRLFVAKKLGLAEKPLRSGAPAGAGAIADFLADEVDLERLEGLLHGLAFTAVKGEPQNAAPGDDASLPAAFWVLKLLFVPEETLRAARLLPRDARLPLPRTLVLRLAAGRVQEAVDEAWRRLRNAGVPLPKHAKPPAAPASGDPGAGAEVFGRRLLAALAIPVAGRDLLAGVRRLGIGRIPAEQEALA
jgi:CRISPR-associated protein Csx17